MIMSCRNLYLKRTCFGPFYQISCRIEGPEGSALVAFTDGFAIPFLRILHCDSIRISSKRLRSEEGNIRVGLLGVGIVMAQATFAHGYEQGCDVAQILAINDNESMHERLVKSYQRFGFKPVYVVEGDKFSDIPHMLVWGGVGTRMDADIVACLRRWKRMVLP